MRDVRASSAMPRARLVYRKQHTTLALVTRAEARTVGAAIVGRRHVNVKGQRHMFVYLHGPTPAFLPDPLSSSRQGCQEGTRL